MATMIDMYAGAPHFVDHLAPVYLALPAAVRGDFIVSEETLLARAARRKVLAVTEPTDPTRAVLITSWGDHKQARQLGRSRIARMEHGIGQSFLGSDHSSYAGGKDAGDISLFLTPNDHSADRWRRAYPNASVAVVGCPKLDSLPQREGGGTTVALSFHWNGMRSGPLAETSGSFGEYARYIPELPKMDGIRVIGHGHPRALPQMARVYERAGIEVVTDFEDVCRQADVLVCDTNSALFEFASTGRPVVVVNGRHFRRRLEHGLRFWAAVGGPDGSGPARVGIHCDSPADLEGRIREALTDPEPERREAALDLVYAYRTGAAMRAAKVLHGWAAGLTEVAA